MASGDAWDEVIECPNCHTTKLLKPNLRFLYSECCGSALCASCVDAIFGQSKQVACSGCDAMLRKSKYKKERLATQQFNNEANNRARVGKICILREKDYPTKIEWNDYLEMVEDIVFDLTYGNSTEKQIAEKKLFDFSKKYERLIQQNRELEIAETQREIEKQQQRAEHENRNGLTENEMKQQGDTYRFMHPAAKEAPRCLDRSDNPQIPSYVQTSQQLIALQQIAGGFDIKQSRKKDQYEAMAGLLDF